MTRQLNPNRAHATPRRDTRWMELANCIGVPSEVLFPPKGSWVTSGARRVCQGCDVRAQCLEHALAHGEWAGIWGGKSPEERREIARRRRART